MADQAPLDERKRQALLALADEFVAAVKRGEIPERLTEDLAEARVVDVLNLDETRLHDDLSRPMRGALTEPEALALSMASYGLTRQQTADALGKSLDTIGEQQKVARRKLKAKTTTHAVAIAIRRGLIS